MFQVFSCVSLGVTCLSTFTFILQTFPQFQDETDPSFGGVVKVIEILDTAAMIFFTLEYLLRLFCSPRTWDFFIRPMNLIDLLAILPFYLSLVLHNLEDVDIVGKAGKQVRLIRILRIMRIFRIFKLVRHFAGLQSLIYTLNMATTELGMLMLLVTVTVLTFACLVYYAEKDSDESGQWNVLDSIWWAVLTLTTVGPPHKNPTTLLGKFFAGMCALVGIFILTLPIPIIVNSFTSHYKNRMWRTELAVKRAEMLDHMARPKQM